MNGIGRKVGLVLYLLGLALSGLRLSAQSPEGLQRIAPPGTPNLDHVLEAPPSAPSQPKPPALSVALQRPSTSELERDETQLFHPLLRLDLPGPQGLFRLESEDQLRERLRQEAKQRPGVARGNLEFPDDRITLSKEPFPTRYWQQQVEVVEPYYVAYRKLYFNQINLSRYGWDMGVLAPLISAGTFVVDFASMPLQILSDPCRCFEYNTGYFLPGDPVPFLLYPPRAK